MESPHQVDTAIEGESRHTTTYFFDNENDRMQKFVCYMMAGLLLFGILLLSVYVAWSIKKL